MAAGPSIDVSGWLEEQLAQASPDLLRALIFGTAWRRARGPKYRDCLAKLGQQAEPLDELRLDPQHSPRVGVHPVARPAPVKQPLIGRGFRDVLSPQGGGALPTQPATRLGVQAHGPKGSRNLCLARYDTAWAG